MLAVTKNAAKANDFGKFFVVSAVFVSAVGTVFVAVGTVFVDEPRWCFLRKSF